MEGAAGLPVGVQIASEPWRDELVLRVMREVEAGVKFSGRPETFEAMHRAAMTA
jgi:Asp-tRNA(Asn)/Glu-tRNA(Gln) amidotransferase A subunit family amidase